MKVIDVDLKIGRPIASYLKEAICLDSMTWIVSINQSPSDIEDLLLLVTHETFISKRDRRVRLQSVGGKGIHRVKGSLYIVIRF